MSAKDLILATYAVSDSTAKAYLAGLTADDLLVRPVPGQNHIAWQLGHLVLSEQRIVDQIKPGSSPALPPGFEEGHGRKQFTVDDPTKYLATEDYIKLMDAQREATKKVLGDMSDAELEAPGPEGLRQMAPTVASSFLLIGNHYLMHIGQFVSVRRKLDKPIAF